MISMLITCPERVKKDNSLLRCLQSSPFARALAWRRRLESGARKGAGRRPSRGRRGAPARQRRGADPASPTPRAARASAPLTAPFACVWLLARRRLLQFAALGDARARGAPPPRAPGGGAPPPRRAPARGGWRPSRWAPSARRRRAGVGSDAHHDVAVSIGDDFCVRSIVATHVDATPDPPWRAQRPAPRARRVGASERWRGVCARTA